VSVAAGERDDEWGAVPVDDQMVELMASSLGN
jgi:hypothetical protein